MVKNKSKYFKEPKLQLVEQKIFIKSEYPDSETFIRNGVLYWYGVVKPTPFSKEYQLKMEYRMGKYPRMWLVSEELNVQTAHLIPHHYSINVDNNMIELCLFRPKFKEWMKNYPLSHTIIPWAIEWTYYYEIWKITGEWNGGGNHPTNKDCKNSTKYREQNEREK